MKKVGARKRTRAPFASESALSENCISTCNDSKNDAELQLQASNLNVSAGGKFYEKAKSRRQRHRLALMSSEQSSDAVPLGKSSEGSRGKCKRARGGRGHGPGRTATATLAGETEAAKNQRIRQRLGIGFDARIRAREREQEEEAEKVRELIESGRVAMMARKSKPSSSNNIVNNNRKQSSSSAVESSCVSSLRENKSNHTQVERNGHHGKKNARRRYDNTKPK